MERKDRFAGQAILLAALLMATAEEGARANQVNFGSQAAEREFRDTVEIGNDSGGYVAEYALRLYEMKEARQRVRFVGVSIQRAHFSWPCRRSRLALLRGHISGSTLPRRRRRPPPRQWQPI